MAIQYSFRQEGDVLLATATGFDEAREDVIRYNNAVMEKAIESGNGKILCDERQLEYRLNVMDTFEAGQYVAAIARYVNRIAIVTHERNRADAEFWETVARNRGLQVRVFFNMEDARAWMGLDQPLPPEQDSMGIA
jgi:hypothetical protein